VNNHESVLWAQGAFDDCAIHVVVV